MAKKPKKMKHGCHYCGDKVDLHPYRPISMNGRTVWCCYGCIDEALKWKMGPDERRFNINYAFNI